MHCPYCQVDYTEERPCYCHAKREEVREPEQPEERRTEGARMGGAQDEWYVG